MDEHDKLAGPADETPLHHHAFARAGAFLAVEDVGLGHARVTGLVARVHVRQEFRNDGAEWVEGVYVFPLPDEAAVDQLRMTIGERIIEGEIREKAEAKKEYEQAKAEGKKASLVTS